MIPEIHELLTVPVFLGSLIEGSMPCPQPIAGHTVLLAAVVSNCSCSKGSRRRLKNQAPS